MKKGVKKTTEKYITMSVFEKAMASIAKSFDRHEKVLQDILQELRAMREDNKYFRIATTKGEIFGTGENVSKNNLFVLDDTMNIIGRLEDDLGSELAQKQLTKAQSEAQKLIQNALMQVEDTIATAQAEALKQSDVAKWQKQAERRKLEELAMRLKI